MVDLPGLTMALHVRKQTPDARIIVLEKNRHPVPEAAFKVGESTVEIAAHYFGKVLDLEDHIAERAIAQTGLAVLLWPRRQLADRTRLELGGTTYPTTPSYQLDRGRFENYLGRTLPRSRVSISSTKHAWRKCRPHSRKKPHAGRLPMPMAHARSIQARWLVDASGRAGLLKRQLSLGKAVATQSECRLVSRRRTDQDR